MGSNDGEIWILRPHPEPLIQGVEAKAPGVRVSSFKEWTSLRKFVDDLSVAELVRIHNGHNPFVHLGYRETDG